MSLLNQTIASARTPELGAPQVELVIPVYNEEQVLRDSVQHLHRHMVEHTQLDFRITIADNASADRTAAIGAQLARELPTVSFISIGEQGRGRALRAAWTASDAEVVAYMDVDLSTDLSALTQLLAPLLDGSAELAIGSRLTAGADVTRSVKRELISRAYNRLLHTLLDAGFSDAQCGFKAGRRDVVQQLLGHVQDEHWFFDTELLYLAQRNGLRIHEVPVRWVEDSDSRVKILATAHQDLRGIARLRARARVGTDRISRPKAPINVAGSVRTQQSTT